MDAKAFLKIYPYLETVDDLAMAVLSALVACSGDSDLYCRHCGTESVFNGIQPSIDAISFSRGEQKLTATEAAEIALEEISRSTLAPVVDRECIESIRLALSRFVRPAPPSDYESIAHELAVNLPLDGLEEELAIQAFGGWGAHFFLVARQYDNQVVRIFSRNPKRSAFAPPGHDPHEPLDGLTVRRPKHREILPDKDRYTVQVADRPACKLTGRPFCLFLVLWQHPNRMLGFGDLADETAKAYDKENSVDSLPHQKSRLCRELKEGGYSDLARCIETGQSCYGLMFPR